MLPLSLTLKNTYSHADSYLNLRHKKICLITGEIEGVPDDSSTAGKSVIFSAIEFALFGVYRAGASRFVRDGEKEGGVSFIFRGDDGNIYLVERSVKLGKNESVTTELGFYYLEGNEWARKEHDTEKNRPGLESVIRKVVGMDYEVFRHSVRLQTQDIGLFPKADRTARRDVLTKFIDVSKWENLENIAKENTKNTKNLLDTEKKITDDLETRIENPIPLQTRIKELEQSVLQKTEDRKVNGEILRNLESRLAKIKELKILSDRVYSIESDLKTQHSLINQFNSTIQGIKDNYKSELDDFKKRSSQKNEVSLKRKNLIEKLSSLDDKKQVLENLRSEISKIREKLEEVQKNHAVCHAGLELIKNQKNQIDKIEGKCPTCLSEMDTVHKEKLFVGLKEEFEGIKLNKKNLSELILSCKEELENSLSRENDLFQQVNTSHQIKSEIDSIDNILEKLSRDEADLKVKKGKAKTKIEELDGNLKRSQALMEELQTRFVQIRNEYEVAKNDAKDQDGVFSEFNRVKSVLTQIDSDLSNLQKTSGELKSRLEISNNLRLEVQQKRVKIDELQNQWNVQKLVEKSLGKQGIQAIILENSITYFEASTREYLQRFTNGKYDIKFDTTAVSKKNDNVREVLDVMIDKGNGIWHPYESFSGGETTKIDLALRAGLVKLSASFSSVRQEYLFIDEIAGGLDRSGRRIFVDILLELSKDFSLILVITHFSELQEMFNDVITVKKSGFVSTIIDKDRPEAEDLYPKKKIAKKRVEEKEESDVDFDKIALAFTESPPVDNEFYAPED